MGDKRLSEVIDYKEHIKPYRIIEIVAGMGAGKNYWVENVLMEDQRVLLITSRKAKVQETKIRTGLGSCLNLTKRKRDNILYLLYDEKERGSCVCNNWQIERYMKEVFNPGDPKTFLWQFFDVIVLDEAHSLATDATYTDVSFYVLDFLRAVYKFSNLPMILMTATPAPIDGLFRLSNPEKFHLLDVREECRCIIPEKIWHRTQQHALEGMVFDYNCRKQPGAPRAKVVCFSTKIRTIANKIIPFLVSAGVPEDVIAVSFSQEECEEKFSKTILENKVRTEAYLSEHEDLPPDIMFFFTTSRNKEGINIANKDVYWDVYIESHWKEEAMQMWGRIREGRTQKDNEGRSPIDSLTFIDDAPQHDKVYGDCDWSTMVSLANKDIANATLNDWCRRNDINREKCWFTPKGKTTILSAHKSFPYLRYSITDHKFYLYRGRLKGEESFAKSVTDFEDYVNLYRGWRPDALEAEDPFAEIPSWFLIPPDRQEQFEDYAREKGFLNGAPMLPNDQAEMLTYVSDELMVRQKSNGNKKYSQLARALAEFGYTLKECTKKKEHPLYGYYRLVPRDRDAGGDFDDTI